MKIKTILTTVLAVILCLTGSAGLDAKKKKDQGDLIVKSMSAPSSADVGSEIKVIVKIKNKGKKAAKPSYTNFYLSSDGKVDSADYYLGNAKVSSLKKNKSSKKTRTYLTIPSEIPAGSYYLIAMADGTEKIKEKSEKNNYRKRKIVIKKFEVSGLNINPDYTDPFIARIEFNATDDVPIEAIEFYGSKSDEVIKTESALVHVDGYDSPVSMHFDEFGRPHQMNANDGSAIKIDYDETYAYVHFLGDDGSFGVFTVPLAQEALNAVAEIEGESSVKSISESSPVINFINSQPFESHSAFRSSESVSSTDSLSGKETQGGTNCNELKGNKLTVCAPVYEFEIKRTDDWPYQALFDVHIKKISCAPFNCKVIIEDVSKDTKKVKVIISDTVDISPAQLVEAISTCEKIQKNLLSTDSKEWGFGGIMIGIATCIATKGASWLFGTLAGVVTAEATWRGGDYATAPLIEQQCSKEGPKMLAYTWLKDKSTKIMVELHSYDVYMKRNYRHTFPEIKPFSRIEPWVGPTLEPFGTYAPLKRGGEQCDTCQANKSQLHPEYVQTASGTSEDLIQVAASIENEQPQPLRSFYAPPDSECKCPNCPQEISCSFRSRFIVDTKNEETGETSSRSEQWGHQTAVGNLTGNSFKGTYSDDLFQGSLDLTWNGDFDTITSLTWNETITWSSRTTQDFMVKANNIQEDKQFPGVGSFVVLDEATCSSITGVDYKSGVVSYTGHSCNEHSFIQVKCDWK